MIILLNWIVRKTSPYAVVLVLFSTVLILAGTLTPSTKLWESRLWDYDKIGHAGLFFGWTWNVCLMLEVTLRQKVTIAKGVMAAILFGGIIEVLQAALPINRGADLIDWGADAFGGLAGAWLFVFFIVRKDVGPVKSTPDI